MNATTAPATRQIPANGIDFGVVVSGPEDGPLALLLHGFPDTPNTWRHLRPALEAAGFRVAAPFMRGYAPSGIPADGRYHLANLVTDAIALRDALGGDARSVLIGHDWGASVAYAAAVHAPERFRRIVTLAIPPPLTLAATFGTYDQLKRSWYMYFFQSPLALKVLQVDAAGFLARIWRDWSPGFDPEADVAEVVRAIPDRAHLEAVIGYYRSMMGQIAPDPALAAIEKTRSVPTPIPVLYLHGADDGCVGADLGHGAEDVLPAGSRVERLGGVGHFLQLEAPDTVNEAILDFLREEPRVATAEAGTIGA